MKVYNVGGDCLEGGYEWDHVVAEKYDWFVYSYELDWYEGSGEAVGYKDGILYFYNLGHCSCYGPLEAGGEATSVVSWKASVDIHDVDTRDGDIRAKLIELLN